MSETQVIVLHFHAVMQLSIMLQNYLPWQISNHGHYSDYPMCAKILRNFVGHLELRCLVSETY